MTTEAGTTMTKAEVATADRENARAKLRELLPVGTEVRTILRRCSASGMTRWISIVIDGEEESWLVAKALGVHVDRKWGGIKREGCGMDMGFDLVYALGRAMFGEGFACVGDGCPSNDHSNRKVVGWHTSGGYALRHRWL